MKSAYLIYALLCVTVVLAVEDTVQSETTSTESLNNSHSESNTKRTTAIPDIIAPNPTSTNITTTPTPTTVPITTNGTTAPTTTVITTTNATTITTATPSTTTPATTPSTSTTPKTTSHIPTSPPTSTSTASSKTTAVPPSSKDRHFDGLSFFGGIILTTCLMAIAAFSWKFYRQCKEGNYRTL